MERFSDQSPPGLFVVVEILQQVHGDTKDTATLESLATAIMPYLARTNLSLEDAVRCISINYMHEHARVEQLLASPVAPEWQAVLARVVTYAENTSLFPKDTEAVGAPDLDAFEDIRRKLSSYNFQGPLDRWITVTVTNRLRRYWRDRQALRAGGAGFANRAANTEAHMSVAQFVPTAVYHHSLEEMADSDVSIADVVEADQSSIEDEIEAAALQQLVTQVVDSLDHAKPGLHLLKIWLAADRHYKLREIADQLGLSISQVHRRIELIREHLRQSIVIQQWFDSRS